jgi:acetylornithine deacetylase/succinyl-diaminopimelate desuccinylase-like protein
VKVTAKTNQLPPIDWDAVQDETAQHLQRLIQMDTRNPPGNEMQVARYLESVLRAAGIDTRLFEPVRDRGAIVARIPGTGERGAVMLLAHMDVVAVEREHWTVDPFAGVIHDGYVYGRGAIDDKGMLAVNLVTMLLLQRHVVAAGGQLTRDVVFVATSDEEMGGLYGIDWLIDNEPEQLRAEFALNEGGRLRIVGGEPLYAAIQTSEKVSHVVTVTAHGPVGHASVPLPGNAVTRLARALAAIGGYRESVKLLPTTRRFFEELSRVWPDAAEAAAMKDLVAADAERSTAGAERLAERPAFDAVLRSGISPTIVRGGSQSNVIPGQAEGVLCIRTLPDESVDSVVGRLVEAVNDPDVEIVVTQRGEDSPGSSFESPMFEALEATIRELAPATAVVPYLSTGATDSARLRRWGVQSFGLLPFPLDEGDEKRMHGHDERVALAALGFGTRLVCQAIHRVAR